MKKFGKFEQRPQPNAVADVPAKKENTKAPKVKNVLLQTYFTSLVCLILCVTMFFGTSYAWFTSEVNNPENEIYVGTLKVGLLKETKTDPEDLAKSDVKLFDKNIRWEPGYTTMETVQVLNKGDLAFKYVMTFTDGTLADDKGSNTDGTRANDNAPKLEDVANFFDVWVFDYQAEGVEYKNPTSYSEISKKNGWKSVGTLAQVLAGETVLTGEMKTVRQDDEKDDPTTPNDTDDGVETVHKYTIALHMNELATADVMGQKIKLNVKLVAYQLASEKDEFGNEFDSKLATAASAKELKDALATNDNVVLASHITLAKSEECVTVKTPMFDGNGKTITYDGDRINNSSVGVVTTSGGKIANLTIDGKKNGRALYVTKLTSDLVVTNSILSGAYSFNLNSSHKADDAIISFIDTSFTSWTSYANVAKHVYFTDCTFGDILRPYGDTTLTNCAITAEDQDAETLKGLDLSALEKDEVITLINCTYNGEKIEKAVLTFDGEKIKITESDAIKISESDACKANSMKLIVLNDNP